MPDVLEPSVVAAVTNSDFKILAETVSSVLASSTAMTIQNAVSHQHKMNTIGEAFIAEAVLPRAGVDVSEAIGIKKINESDFAAELAKLAAAVADIQMLMKGAQTTPPVTAPQPAL